MEMRRELTLAVPIERAWTSLRGLECGRVVVDDGAPRRAEVRVDGPAVGCPPDLTATISVAMTAVASATSISVAADVHSSTGAVPGATAADMVDRFIECIRHRLVDGEGSPPPGPADDESEAGLTVASASAPGARAAAAGESPSTEARSPLDLLAGDAGLVRRLGPIVGLALAVLWLVRRRWR